MIVLPPAPDGWIYWRDGLGEWFGTHPDGTPYRLRTIIAVRWIYRIGGKPKWGGREVRRQARELGLRI